MIVRSALNSPRRVQSRRGRDWETISAEIVEDNGMAIRKAKVEAAAINGEHADGNPVHWREVLSLPTPEGFQFIDTDEKEPANAEQPAA